jgi:glutamate synthase domain-containing protein 3/Pyruvate/2-oxoacid:ferredoxin oxidoreductase delta subunit
MKKTFKIKTLEDNNRMSTQELLQIINQQIENGCCDFEIEACGQHNIGGSVWSKSAETLTFKVKNPGQRVGAMAMSGTKITVEGSAPADVGWLNSGAEIIVKGDGGDTTAHCAASGNIYVAGRTGTRSGAMMKHDPKFNPPQFWVLKNTGSFSFEFMGGGIAIICGQGCEELESVLGQRSCVGMLGGTIYFRGNHANIADCVKVLPLENEDKEFLKEGIEKFLQATDRNDVKEEITDFTQWQKIIPKEKSKVASDKNKLSIKNFRTTEWVDGGIFGDFVDDDLKVYDLATTGEGRLNIPAWTNKESCIDCKICINNCPQDAILEEDKSYEALDEKCIGCGICETVCPKSCWKLQANSREIN